MPLMISELFRNSTCFWELFVVSYKGMDVPIHS